MAKGFGTRVLTPQQEKEVKIIKRSILKHFQCLKEPRTGRRQDHNLTAIVTIGILAVLSGADGFVAIEAYGKAKREWLETFLQDLRKSDNEGRIFKLVTKIVIEQAVLKLINSLSSQSSKSIESNPDQQGTTDVIALNTSLTTLATF